MSSDTDASTAAEAIGRTVFSDFISEQSLPQLLEEQRAYQAYVDSLPPNPSVKAYLGRCQVDICINP